MHQSKVEATRGAREEAAQARPASRPKAASLAGLPPSRETGGRRRPQKQRRS